MALAVSDIQIALPFLASSSNSWSSSSVTQNTACSSSSFPSPLQGNFAPRKNSCGARFLEQLGCKASTSSCRFDQGKMKPDGAGLVECYSILKGEDSHSTLRERMGRGQDAVCKAQLGSAAPVTEAEKEGWDKRQSEGNGGVSSWQWTLNWNEITSSIVVGSCPRSPDDVDRIVEGSGVNAILNLQSDLCFDALKIPFESIKRRASERGVYLQRVAIRDFDHGDQALMLPEAVRILNMLVARGLKVYVHCTAGINRATLTVVAYLTFIQGMDLDNAVSLVKSARSIAHPYVDCWVEARRRLLEGRSEELSAVSRQIYESRHGKGMAGNSKSDWEAAQKQVITNTFSRWLQVDLGVIETELDLLDRQYAAALRKVKTEFENDMADARAQRNHVTFDYAQYVAAAATVVAPTSEVSEEDEVDPAAALECDVITRECFSPNESDPVFQKPLRWYLSRGH